MRIRVVIFLLGAFVASLVGYAVSQAVGSISPVQLPSSDPWPIGQIAFSPGGTLYFVNEGNGEIDELVGDGIRTVLAVPDAHFYPVNKSLTGAVGLAVTSRAIWFTSEGLLYRSSLDGAHITHVPAAPDAALLALLPGDTLLYSTLGNPPSAIFERQSNGSTRRVAGGGDIDATSELASPHRATEEGFGQAVGMAGVSESDFYFTYDNSLLHVQGGIASELSAPNSNFFNGEMASGPRGITDVVCSWSMCRVKNGIVTDLFRLPTQIQGRFVGPSALAISPDGTVYEAYTASATSPRSAEGGGIMRISPTGKPTVVIAAKY